jgi:signal transduction histidine kinase
MLDDLGLLPTLISHFEQYTRSTAVRVSFTHAGLRSRRFDPDVETAAYRIIQESLTNVARHAAIPEVQVQARADARSLSVFDLNGVTAAASGGLPGMRERAGLLGGEFVVESRPGSGTEVRARLPLDPSSAKPPRA